MDSDPPNKEEVVERLLCARFGTAEKFFQWYGKWFQRRVKNRDVPESDWEDLAKDALRVAIDQMQRDLYRGHPDQLPAWLRTITEGIINDYWRKRKLRNEIPLPPDAEEYTDDPQELSGKLALRTGMLDAAMVKRPDDLESKLESKELVDKTFGALPDKERGILHLFLHGFKTKEISAMLGLPEGTVSGCLKRAQDGFRIIFTKLSREGILLPFTSALRQHEKEKSKEDDG